MQSAECDALRLQLQKIGQYERLDELRYLAEELLRWSKTHNLTAYQSWPQVANGLLADSLWLAAFCEGDACLDIGSGAGFPGLMIALARPAMQVTMLEARRKRVSFQQHACRMLGLANARPLWGRAGGETDPLAGQRFSTVTCKALASLPQALALCQNYVRPGGLVLLPRGISDWQVCAQIRRRPNHGWAFALQTYSLAGLGERLLLSARSL